MNTFIVKSLFASLCTFALLATGSQVLGMNQQKIKLSGVKAAEKYQKYARQCYKNLTERFGEEFNKSNHQLSREEIDKQIKERDSLCIFMSTKNITSDYVNGVRAASMGDGIYLNKSEYLKSLGDFEKNDGKNINYLIKIDICHEVAHIWLGHCFLPSPPTLAQTDFEVETLLVKILPVDLTFNSLLLHPEYNENKDSNSYLFGTLNGLSKLKKCKMHQELFEKIEHNVKLLQLLGNPNDENQGGALRIFQLVQKLSKDWQPMKTYEEAKIFVNKILGITHKK